MGTMFRPGTDENEVRMSDVLCDFCHRAWTEDVPVVEGHQGAIICGNCLAVGYDAIVNHDGGAGVLAGGYACRMCLENDEDRAALDRPGERGWPSPLHPDVAICTRCVRMAAEKLTGDPDFAWTPPGECSSF